MFLFAKKKTPAGGKSSNTQGTEGQASGLFRGIEMCLGCRAAARKQADVGQGHQRIGQRTHSAADSREEANNRNKEDCQARADGRMTSLDSIDCLPLNLLSNSLNGPV